MLELGGGRLLAVKVQRNFVKTPLRVGVQHGESRRAPSPSPAESGRVTRRKEEEIKCRIEPYTSVSWPGRGELQPEAKKLESNLSGGCRLVEKDRQLTTCIVQKERNYHR